MMPPLRALRMRHACNTPPLFFYFRRINNSNYGRVLGLSGLFELSHFMSTKIHEIELNSISQKFYFHQNQKKKNKWVQTTDTFLRFSRLLDPELSFQWYSFTYLVLFSQFLRNSTHHWPTDRPTDPPTHIPTDWPTKQRNDWRTNTPSYIDAKPHLKTPLHLGFTLGLHKSEVYF